MTSAHESLAFRPAVQLAQSIASGRLRSAELVEHYLERIARYDAKLHAFVEVYADDARNAADAADRAIDAGHAVGPLHGLPVALKDLVDMHGRVTSGGCKLWAQRVSPTTATLAKRLIGAGIPTNPRASIGADPSDDVVLIGTSEGELVTLDPPVRDDPNSDVLYWKQEF